MDAQDRSKDEQEKEISKIIIPSKRAQFYANYYRQQDFAFPDSIIYYITMKPSTPKGYQSIIQTCKYFFIKNPIIIHPRAFCDSEDWQYYINEEWQEPFDLKKLFSKFWITDRLDFRPYTAENQSILSSLIPKFYRFDAKYVCISDQILTFNDYAYLSKSAEYIYFDNVVIVVTDENDSIVALEKLIEIATNAKSFTFLSDTKLSNISSKTAKELFENSNFLRFKYIKIDQIPDAFDIESFYKYMKKNNFTKLNLHFDDSISAAYKNRLNEIIDEILTNDVINFKTPCIRFRELEYQKYYKLQSIHEKLS